MKAKTFFKFFLTFLVIFTLVLTPIFKAASNINLFKGGSIESISSEMSVLVDPESPFFEAFTETERLNMMVVGVNQGMTDVIMMVSWDMKHDLVDVISVPRDTYYERPGYNSPGQKKINSIYNAEGIVGTANAVSDVLYGMPINYYAVVDYEAVENIVNDIGGVPMNIEKTMEYKDPYDEPPLEIYIPAGYQVLDGEHAVQFLRFRKGYADGDIGRIRAQQEFIKSAFKQCLSNGLVSSVKSVCNNVESDLTLGAASKYALSAIGLKDDSIRTYMLPGEGQYIGVTSYFVQDTPGTEQMLTQIYSSPAPETEGESAGEGGDAQAAA